MQQKIASVFLLLIFAYNLTGHYFIFEAQQYHIKKEVKRKIKNSVSENELIILSFHPSSKEYNTIEWMGNHEFRYKGQMYDIVRQSIHADGTIKYYCINDKQEKELFANLDEHIKNHINDNETSEKNSKNISKKLTKEYFFQHLKSSFFTTNKSIVFKYLNFSSNKGIEDILTPPPNKI